MAEAKKIMQYVAALSAAGSSFVLGLMIGWTNPTQAAIQNGALGFKVSDAEFGWVGSALTLGATVMSVPTGFLINAIGRKMTIVLAAIPIAIGWLLIMFARNLIMLLVARFMLGAVGGAFGIVIPIYVGEIVQTDIRGRCGTFFQLLFTTGILFVFIIGAFIALMPTNIICLAITVLNVAIFRFMPESPVYYVYKGNTEKAARSLRILRGKDYDFARELNELLATDRKQKEKSLNLWSALSRTATRRAIVITSSLMFFQQLCGINAVIFYSTSIFEQAGTGIDANASTIAIGIVQVAITALSMFLMDHAGRRILLLISAFFMALCTNGLALYFYMKKVDETSVKAFGWLPVSSLCIFIVMFALGFGPVPWCLIGELFASDIRGPAGSIAGTSNCFFAFVVTKTFGNVKNAIGIDMTFWLFSGITLLGAVFVLLLVPETKGKDFKEIQKVLGSDE